MELTKKVKLYEKILPVCCKCKKIRDDSGELSSEGDWVGVEEFIKHLSKAHISHTYCPQCAEETMKEIGNG